jgi:hypothetical protein
MVFAACGGDDEPERAATAEEGSEFCTRAAEAESLGDEVNAVSTDPAKVQPAVEAVIAAYDATLELAPDDILEVMTRSVAYQKRVAEVVEANGWDLVAAAGTEEGQQIFSDTAAQADRDEIRAYLEDKCGIEDDTEQPTDTTVAGGATGDTTGGVTGDGTPIDLPEGEEGIDRFVDLYAIGTSTEVTDEQRQCIQDELRDKVTVEQLELLVGGGIDEEAQIAVGLAFITCEVIQA